MIPGTFSVKELKLGFFSWISLPLKVLPSVSAGRPNVALHSGWGSLGSRWVKEDPRNPSGPE